MLSTLHLQNFRGFSDHRLWLRPLAVVVGQNNAGKSTLIEALRTVAEILPRLSRGRWVEPTPLFRRLGVTASGVLLELPGAVRAATVFHRYGSAPAVLDATFNSGGRLQLVLADAQTAFAIVTDPAGRTITSRQDLPRAALGRVMVLPQLGPLEEDETTLKQTYVRQCLDTHRTSRQFRNQLRYQHSQYAAFVQLFQDTWPTVRIAGFDSMASNHGDPLALLLSEDGFVAEAADFGHGLQMWLQLVWFLSRVPEHATVVLDEPDVYVHPRQQCSLMEILRRRSAQTILATHSPTIISQSTPDELLRVHRATAESQPGLSEPHHQQQIAAALEHQRKQALQGSIARVADAKPPQRSASEEHGANQADKPLRTACIEVKVYENAAFTATDSAGNVVLQIAARGSATGKKLKEIVDVEPLTLLIQEPENVEIRIDGKEMRLPQGQQDVVTLQLFELT